MSREDGEDPLTRASLRAGDLRRVAGLSYRQVSEWDRREALPNARQGQLGWRRVNGWQAIALRIVSEVRRRFGVPLAKHDLLAWMLGEVPTVQQILRMNRANLLLYGLSQEEERALHDLAEAIRRDLKPATNREDMRPGPVDPSPTSATQPPTPYDYSADLKRASGPYTDRLVSRGWTRDAAADFTRRFFALSVNPQFGLAAFSQIPDLLGRAQQANDPQAVRAVNVLAHALLPLFEPYALMRIGFVVLLVTDLESASFYDESSYLEAVRDGRLPKTAIVLEVNGHINDVLTAIGQAPWPATIRAAQAEPQPSEPGERQILELVRQRDFDKLIIRPKGGGYHIQVERTMTVEGEREIEALLKAHDYQTVTAVRVDGKILNVTQSVSMLTHPADYGKIPARRLTRRGPKNRE